MKVFGASGDLLDGSPIICGGTLPVNNSITNKCFIYNFTIAEWKFLCNMKTARTHHRALAVDYEGGALWITGGDNKGSSLLTSEFIFLNGTVSEGPKLPEEMTGHCMVKWHDGRIMFLGGDFHPKDVHIYDFSRSKFFKGPSLDYIKYNPTCTVFRSSLHYNRPVVLITGGMTEDFTDSKSSLIFDYTYQYAWENGMYLANHSTSILMSFFL